MFSGKHDTSAHLPPGPLANTSHRAYSIRRDGQAHSSSTRRRAAQTGMAPATHDPRSDCHTDRLVSLWMGGTEASAVDRALDRDSFGWIRIDLYFCE